ncbi:MAG: EcsC family protein [Rhodospirillales bacterium]|nr:MAG: EcsC family protein [Rhodospirillales bacterium]
MPATITMLAAADRADLAAAVEALEHPSLAARIASVIGKPVEEALRLLPQRWHDGLHGAAEGAIRRALTVAVTSLHKQPSGRVNGVSHRTLATVSGAVGGYFGMPALLLELPVATILMLRAIADVARAHGEDLQDPASRLACLEVFAIGGRSPEVTYTEIGYYEVRAMLAVHFTPMARAVADGGTAALALPAGVNLVRGVAARFGAVISDSAAAKMVPVLGAASGALINAVFMRHFQEVAQGHFTIRRLERRYGADVIDAAYRDMVAEQEDAARHKGASAAASA